MPKIDFYILENIKTNFENAINKIELIPGEVEVEQTGNFKVVRYNFEINRMNTKKKISNLNYIAKQCYEKHIKEN